MKVRDLLKAFFLSRLNIFIGFFHLNDFGFILAIALLPRCNCILKTQRKNTYFTEFCTRQTERATLREIDRGRQIALTGERKSRKFIVTLRVGNHTAVVVQCLRNAEPDGSFKGDACSNSNLSLWVYSQWCTFTCSGAPTSCTHQICISASAIICHVLQKAIQIPGGIDLQVRICQNMLVKTK